MTAEVFPKKVTEHEEAETKYWTRFKTAKREILAAISLAMINISYGMVFAFTGTLLPVIRDFVDQQNGTWLAATNAFLMVVGTFSSLLVIPRIGNKISLIVTRILEVCGWWILSLATQFYQFEIGCIFIGFSIGFAFQISLACRMELLSETLRGVMSSIICSCFMFGILMGHLSTIILPWRLAMACCSVIPLLSMIHVIFFFPEIPSWLLSRGNTEQAKEMFFWLHGVSENSEAEFLKMKEKQEKLDASKKMRALETVASKKFLVPLLIGSVLLTAQSGSGYDVIVIYSVDLLKEMSSSIDPAQATIIFDSTGCLFCILSCFVVEKISRRKLFFISSGGTLSTLVMLLAIIVYKFPIITFLVCICLYTAFVNMALLPLSWLIMTEVFPESSRHVGICVSSGYFYFFTFSLTKAVPFIVSIGGIGAAFEIFIGILTACTILLYFVMPETKKFSSNEIKNEAGQGNL